jgi:curved DNA-binding protein CbpA
MTQTISDPYAVLGIPRGASEQQVRQAYRRLAMRYHPDLHPDADASERMRRINQAWEMLSSPLRRARYDSDSSTPRSQSYGHWSASARASAQGATRPESWAEPTWTSGPAAARTYPRPTTLEDDRPGFSTVVITAVVGLLAFVALFAGILPVPLFGIALLVIVRGIFGRFD